MGYGGLGGGLLEQMDVMRISGWAIGCGEAWTCE